MACKQWINSRIVIKFLIWCYRRRNNKMAYECWFFYHLIGVAFTTFHPINMEYSYIKWNFLFPSWYQISFDKFWRDKSDEAAVLSKQLSSSNYEENKIELSDVWIGCIKQTKTVGRLACWKVIMKPFPHIEILKMISNFNATKQKLITALHVSIIDSGRSWAGCHWYINNYFFQYEWKTIWHGYKWLSTRQGSSIFINSHYISFQCTWEKRISEWYSLGDEYTSLSFICILNSVLYGLNIM